MSEIIIYAREGQEVEVRLEGTSLYTYETSTVSKMETVQTESLRGIITAASSQLGVTEARRLGL